MKWNHITEKPKVQLDASNEPEIDEITMELSNSSKEPVDKNCTGSPVCESGVWFDCWAMDEEFPSWFSPFFSNERSSTEFFDWSNTWFWIGLFAENWGSKPFRPRISLVFDFDTDEIEDEDVSWLSEFTPISWVSTLSVGLVKHRLKSLSNRTVLHWYKTE